MGRADPLLAQSISLLDAEAVLLVDDDEGEVGELDVLLDERVGADDDAGLAGRRVEQGATTGRGVLATGEQRHGGAELGAAEHPALCEVSEHRRDRAVVLRRQDLGGGQQGGLTARVDGGEHGPQRDDRLARADLALQEPVHRPVGRQARW